MYAEQYFQFRRNRHFEKKYSTDEKVVKELES